jgi:ABC-type nitrate/sulfonate/bicarbonate transport system substrate-binding protein
MSEFDDLEKKAQDFVEEHPEQADKEIDKVADIPEDDTDYQHDEHIDQAMDAAEEQAGQGHDQQGIKATRTDQRPGWNA